MLIKSCTKSLKLLSVIPFVAVLAACGGSKTKSASASESSSQVAASQIVEPSNVVLSQAAASPATIATAAAIASGVNVVPLSANQCDDGIDNDGDGLVDWQYDMGCSDAGDTSEAGLARSEEDGWTTFDLSADSRIVYVSSSEGNDSNDGLSPSRAVASLSKGASLVRDGYPDFLLLKRGDRWRDESFGRLKSGRSNDERLVVSSYGDSTERPVLEVSNWFINDDGRSRSHIALVGLEIYTYRQDPNSAEFVGDKPYGLRLVNNPDNNVLIEDNHFNYSKIVVSYGDNIEIRRNVIYRAYGIGPCDYLDHSNRHQGLYMSYSENSLVEGNVFDGNGWNESLPQSGNNTSCATIYNHNLYVTDVKDLVVKNNVFLRASSIGFKVSSSGTGGVRGLRATGNLFAEGEIGMSMYGNSSGTYTHVDSVVSDNVFTDISRTIPTTRNFSWGIWVGSHDNSLFSNNLFVNPPPLTSNSMAFKLESDVMRGVKIDDNLAHNYIAGALSIYEGSLWDDIDIKGNRWVVNTGAVRANVNYVGNFVNTGTNFSGNSYYSSLPDSNWFYVNGVGNQSLDQWGESGAEVSDFVPSDAGRNVDSYARFLGVGTTISDFSKEARKQSKFNYRVEYEAQAVNAYIREGYTP